MDKALNILLLEDLPEDAGLIERILQKENFHFKTHRVETRDEFIHAIRSVKPDVILSDHSLPQFNSIEALGIIQDLGLKVPFILVTGTVSEEFAVQSIKGGADDYILKANLARLPAAILNALKKRKDERYRRKAKKVLKLQNEKLVLINKKLDSFVYSASHNLQFPLVHVKNILNLAKLENTQKGNIPENYFDMMQSSIGNLAETLRQIVSHYRNSKTPVTIQEIDLKKLIDTCLKNVDQLAGFNRVEVHVSVNQNSPFYSDEFRLPLIIHTLISNAVLFQDDRKDTSILNISMDVDSARCALEISDNGIGITEHLQSKVFEMFFRATERSKGSGLGLYIAREAVRKLQGTIQLESSPGVGTRVMVSLPNSNVLDESMQNHIDATGVDA